MDKNLTNFFFFNCLGLPLIDLDISPEFLLHLTALHTLLAMLTLNCSDC